MLVQLQDAYAEVFRVLKPGSYFTSYEWVSTKEYDPNNKDHVRIMDEINYGNGLPVHSTILGQMLYIALLETHSSCHLCHRCCVATVLLWHCRRCAHTRKQRRPARTAGLS